MPGTLAQLLADPDRKLVQSVRGVYLDAAGTTQTLWVTDDPKWLDPPDGPAATYLKPLLDSRLEYDQSFDPVDPTSLPGGTADIVLVNDALDYRGAFNDAWSWSVDDLAWDIFLHGWFGDGTRLELADVIATPWRRLKGVDKPEAGEHYVTIHARDDLRDLDLPLQPETYASFCLEFPGTVAGAVAFGDVLDRTTSYCQEGWIWTSNPATTQYLWYKGTGYLAYGLVGAGTIEGGVELAIAGATTHTTAAGVIRAFRDHHIAASFDTAADTVIITVDGTTVLTVTGVTGTPAGNATALELGRASLGRISRPMIWGIARSQAVIRAAMRTPVLGTETSLDAAFLVGSDTGAATTIGNKVAGGITGTIGTGTLWTEATWQIPTGFRPFVVGYGKDVPVTWIDPAAQIGEVCAGGYDAVLALRSNHATVSAANYTMDRTRGTLTVTSGSLSGSYSADVVKGIWGTAVVFGAGSLGTATLTSPAGSRGLMVQYRPDATANSFRYLAGWHPTGNPAGVFVLRMVTGAVNRLECLLINDAGTQFTARVDGLIEGLTYSIGATINATAGTVNGIAAMTLAIYVNGEIATTTAVTGTFTATLTVIGVGARANNTFPALGRIDDVLVFNAVVSQAQARALYLMPATGGETGLTNAWDMRDGPGSTVASQLVGAVALTLTAPTWTAGRTAPADCLRFILRRHGWLDAELDADTWRAFLDALPWECAWFVSNGEMALEVAAIFLHSFSWTWVQEAGVLYLVGFSGLSGTATAEFTPAKNILSETEAPIDPVPCGPAIWRWEIECHQNWTVVAKESVAASLLTSDPARWVHASREYEVGGASDASIKIKADGNPSRFPQAIEKRRVTPLLERRWADVLGKALLDIHRHGSCPVPVSVTMAAGELRLMGEISVDLDPVQINSTNLVAVSIRFVDGVAQIVGWRPAP